ncbi:MAG: radical SAM protein [Desulfomonilaceae bacterium]|nr:radical SAM protein [Desulfomonilaceae bacterium]
MKDRESSLPENNCLSVEVTTHCNSDCSHCFVRARGGRTSSLPRDLVMTLIEEGYETGYRRLHVTGGEPLLWDGVTDILDYALARGYRTVFLNTNGTLLTDNIARQLAADGDLAVSISLQGPKHLHDRVRGTGSYDRAVQGIGNALGAGLPVHIFTAVGQSLLPDLPRFAHELFTAFPGIRQLNFIQIIRVPGDVFDLSKEVLAPDQFLRLVKMVSLLNLYGLKTDILNNPLAVVTSRVLGMPWLPLSLPLYQPGSLTITADRRITLAHSTTEDLGLYEPGILPTILGSAGYLRAVSQDGSSCRDCVHSSLCSTQGMMRPSEWYRDMCPQLPYCRRVLAKASSYG